jgi:hypothetical protein
MTCVVNLTQVVIIIVKQPQAMTICKQSAILDLEVKWRTMAANLK